MTTLQPIKLETSTLRERYFRGEIFRVDEFVESDDTLYRIIKRGSNHLLLQDETGKLVSKWIHDVNETARSFDITPEMVESTINRTDRLKVARAVSAVLGVGVFESITNPEQLVNTALRTAQRKQFTETTVKTLKKLLALAEEVNISYNKKLAESLPMIDDGLGKAPVAIGAGTRVGWTLEPRAHKNYLRRMKVKYKTEETMQASQGGTEDIPQPGQKGGTRSDLNDKIVDDIVGGMQERDWVNAYGRKELQYIDVSGGSKAAGMAGDTVSGISVGEEFALEQKQGNRVYVTVKSTPAQLNDRARRLATYLLKTRFSNTKFDPTIMHHNSLAMKLVPGLKKFEKTHYKAEQE